MGGFEGWVQSSSFFPNGLLPNEVASVTRELEPERWALAEDRTAELISCIQPNQPSEERRNAVASYVQRLIAKCFSCQVFTFGSVPLKTYLPDGDIDLTAFSENQNLKDNWANEVRDVLEHEEKNENAEFRVKEVQYIQAEVKIIKCLVENIVVDISFNQLGGLCTLCFLEEVDRLINQNHLFKRSIILIKAWCYYESRILGAHHGLISTYALETLVLYIFHVFNSSFAGPLEVLYRFLEFFSKFDWENYCISLWGPVPISSLPDMTAYPPRKDGGELLLSKLFLDACSAVYTVYPARQDNQEQVFISKHFNVVDPLRTNNNLGRSVNKGNFFRIRSAFAFGAQRLARLLDCPKENLRAELNQFFTNTWERHGKGQRPDAPAPSLNNFGLQQITSNHDNGYETLRNYASSRKARDDREASEIQATNAAHAFGINSSKHESYSLKLSSRASDTAAVSHVPSQKTSSNLTGSKVSHQSYQTSKVTNSNENTQIEKGRVSKTENLVNEAHSMYRFARTQSSPELKDTVIEAQPRGRHNRASDVGNGHIASLRSESRRKKLSPEVLENHGAISPNENSLKNASCHQNIEGSFDSSIASKSCNGDSGGSTIEDHAFHSETIQMHQEEQDHMNMMASFRGYSLGGQDQMAGNLTSGHPLLPIPPPMLASLGYGHKNPSSVVPMHVSFDSPWGLNMHYPQGLVPLPVAQYFPNMGVASNKEEIAEAVNENLLPTEPIQEDTEHGLWSKQGADSVRYDHRNSSTMLLQDDAQQFHSVQSNRIRSPRTSGTGRLPSKDHGLTPEDRDLSREHYVEKTQYQRSRDADAYPSASLRFVSASQASSSGSKMSSEGSWDGSPLRTAKPMRSRQGRISVPSSEPSVSDGTGVNGWQYGEDSIDHMSSQADNESREWIPLSTVGTKMAENVVSADAPSHVHTHKLPGYELASGIAPSSMLPVAPVLVGSESQQRANDNQGALSYAFYPTGPPVPFLAMLPVYNLPNEAESSSIPTSKFDRDEVDNFRYNKSGRNLESTESLDQLEVLDSAPVKDASSIGIAEQRRPDILNGDFASHWQNLQYGRFCQNAQHIGPQIYPSSVVPPMYLQGHFPWDSHGRPKATVNIFPQFVNNGPHLVPISSLNNSSNVPAGIHQHYTEEFPRYRGGTGTYLPNPISVRDRQSSNVRNHRGNYSSERKDHYGDREGSWNNSKSRFGSRTQNNQAERSSMRIDRSAANNRRSERSWNSKQESIPPYYSRSSSLNFSNSTKRNSPNTPPYGMYPLPVVNPNGVSSSGGAVPSVVMLYPYDPNIGYGSSGQHLEFGSFGPVRVEVPSRALNEQQDIRGDSDYSSPDQPSSPQVHRGM